MTTRERIVRLEGLLARVAQNASRPRARRAAPTMLAASAPVAVAPAAVAPARVAPLAVAPPQPSRVFEAPPPPPAPVAPPPAPPEPPPTLEVRAPSASSVPPWKPEPMSTVQARPSSIPPEELSEDDLVEVTTIPPAPSESVAASSSVSADDLDEPPASSRRSKVAESLDQAIASAAEQVDEIEVPIHTPPPESGPQEAVLPAGIEAPRAPEFAELEADVVRPASLGPTPEQLGGTIELDGAEGPTIEIEVAGLPAPEPEGERPVEELEVTLPRADMPSGMYDVSVSMPAEASPVLSAMPTMPAQGRQAPEIMVRPELEDADVTHVIRVSENTPEDFKVLLDASLAL